MKLRKLAPVALGTLVTWTACGDGPTGPAVARNDPGTGTRTMLVSAEIAGKDVPGGFMTDFTVSLRDAQDNPISGASVTVQNGTLGTVTLLEGSVGSGDYVASRNTFAPGDYRLDVVKDTQFVRGVVVGGIAAHEILSPTLNDTIPAAQPLTVTWTRPSEAAGADVETRDYTAEGIADTGSHVVPMGFIQPRTDERVRVKRFNKVDIAGGLFGSELKLSIRVTVEPIVVQ